MQQCSGGLFKAQGEIQAGWSQINDFCLENTVLLSARHGF